MNRRLRPVMGTLVLLGLWSEIAGAADGSSRAPLLDDFAWLAGTWAFETDGRTVTEHWFPPEGGTMLGMSRTVADGRTVAYEFVILRQEADGTINYIAHPSGQATATFALVRWDGADAVFENTAHDFPQRVIYTRGDADTLHAAIEGISRGKQRRIEFPYRRVRP